MIHLDRLGAVLIVTVDRQHVRNAFDRATILELTHCLDAAPADGVRALVLTGAGTVSFSSGMDLKAMATEPPGALSEAVAAFDQALDGPRRPPVIAAVNGAAVGGGFEVMLRCDLAVAADHAEFRLPEVQRGMVPGGGGTLLPLRVPLAVAMEIGIVGEGISAERARELGLLNRVVPGGDVLDVALGFGQRIAANGPRSVARTRALMAMAIREGGDAAWAETRRGHEDPQLRAEAAEGIAAFREGRPPRWPGSPQAGGGQVQL